MWARFAWNICVGSQVLLRCRFLYFDSGGGGRESLFFLILGTRGAMLYG
jgi:hypothetical protein